MRLISPLMPVLHAAIYEVKYTYTKSDTTGKVWYLLY